MQVETALMEIGMSKTSRNVSELERGQSGMDLSAEKKTFPSTKGVQPVAIPVFWSNVLSACAYEGYALKKGALAGSTWAGSGSETFHWAANNGALYYYQPCILCSQSRSLDQSRQISKFL